MQSDKSGIPAVAWRRRLDESLSHPFKPSRPYSVKLLWQMLPVIWRLQRLMRKQKNLGFDPLNFINPPRAQPDKGVPMGGMGGGSITRGWQGDFCRWQLRPGIYHHHTVHADQFSLFVQQQGQLPKSVVLNPNRPTDNSLSTWQWGMNPAYATYHALFPRAWTNYEKPLPNVSLTCRQISPVIAHNYRESSFPVCVFLWQVKNTGKNSIKVGLMFTMQNGWGTENDTAGGHHNSLFHITGKKKGQPKGILLHHAYRQARSYAKEVPVGEREVFQDPLTFAMAALSTKKTQITYRTRFDPAGDGSEVWQDFAADGKLDDIQDESISMPGERIAAALAVTLTLEPGESASIPFALAWDMPLVRSGYGTPYHRRYTIFYGASGGAATRIAQDALLNYPQWEEMIEEWQKPILEDKQLPEWYKAALFNELYYITDGGTLWAYPVGYKIKHPDEDIGHFAYLEGHDYRMVNTYDVHFYASFALAMCWPKLELSLQRDIAQATMREHPEKVKMVFDGKTTQRKVSGMVPHDLGWPDEDLWELVNGYFFHDMNEWKDLNPKFVLQVYRDYVLTQNKDFLREVWPAIQAAMQKSILFDKDGDGLIENAGFPDQTYDTWKVKGPSAYTGGLWLASLLAASQIAGLLEKKEIAELFEKLFQQAQTSFENLLWNGQYYNYDSSHSRHHNSIMADMLAGQWYARACDLAPILNQDNIKPALKMIYDNNVVRFQQGEMGAINGMRPDGKTDRTNMQSKEVWIGTSYALAATLLQEGLEHECWQTASGVVKSTYEKLGYWFQTPEAWDEKGHYRALGYMRPLCIWAIQWAWQKRKSDKSTHKLR